MEFNIGNGKTIGEVDVKQITIGDSSEERFIVAWNEINENHFDTHVQIFNQYGEAISSDTIIESNRESYNSNEDVAIINSGNGSYQIGIVGRTNEDDHSGKSWLRRENTHWKKVSLTENNDHTIEININNSTHKIGGLSDNI